MTRRMTTVVAVTPGAFVAALRAPSLPNAACRHEFRLWDIAANGDRFAVADATLICLRHCPCLPTCRRWLAGLSEDQRPHGYVTAGQVVA